MPAAAPPISYPKVDPISLDQISSWFLTASNLELKYGRPTPVPPLRTPSVQANVHVSLFEGDLAPLDVGAVVNAANERLIRGSGVCEAVFKGAGYLLEQECA